MDQSGQRGTPPLIRATLFGEARISVGTRPITSDDWPRRTTRSLLLLLLTTPGYRLQRDRVLDLLWPEATPKQATNALYVALHGLRRVLEPDLVTGRGSAYIESGPEIVGLRAGVSVSLDIDEFEADVGSATTGARDERRSRLRAALARYTGDLLLDEPYAEWVIAPRDHMRRRCRGAVLDLADLDMRSGEPEGVVPPLERLLDIERTDEVVLRTLMRVLAAAGRRDDAIGWYDRGVESLRDDLDADPEDETRHLAEEIHAIATAAPPVAAVAIRPRAHVPVPPNALIGRGREIERLQDLLLDRDVRLVTVTGPGGVGKTRLVQEVARQVAGDFADGVCFVALAPVLDAARVVSTVARALGLPESGAHPPGEMILAALRDRELLLVLDNCEQVVEAAPHLAALLEGCDRLTMLATSREPLRVRAEHELSLSPLAVPDRPHSGRGHMLAKYEAVALFIARACAVRPDFTVTDENAATIAALCARLDGLPLAIELAAAQSRTMSPDQLLAGLDDRFALLAGGYRDLPARHQTLGDAIAWSYDLLSPPRRTLFRRLAVFAGGFTSESAASVMGHLATGDGSTHESPLSVPPVSDEIDALLDRSLLRRADNDPDTRFTMLESIREFGLGKLSDLGELAAAQHAHAAWVAALAGRAAPELTGAAQGAWLDRLEADLDNIRAALEWTLVQPGSEKALQLASALRRFWLCRGYLVEGRDWLERALAGSEGAQPAMRAQTMFAAGELAYFLEDHRRATALAEEGLEICRSLGDARGIADALLGLGHLARQTGDFERAAKYLEEGMALADAAGDRISRALFQEALGTMFVDRGDLDRAESLFTAALHDHRQTGHERGAAANLSSLGTLAQQRGNIGQAMVHLEESVAIVRRLRDAYATATILRNMSELVMRQGDYPRAASLIREGLSLSWDHGLTAITTANLRASAGLAAVMGQPGRSARLYGAIETFCRVAGTPLPDSHLDPVAGGEVKVRAVLGDEVFAAERRTGATYSPAEVISEAMEVLVRPAVAGSTRRSR